MNYVLTHTKKESYPLAVSFSFNFLSMKTGRNSLLDKLKSTLKTLRCCHGRYNRRINSIGNLWQLLLISTTIQWNIGRQKYQEELEQRIYLREQNLRFHAVFLRIRLLWRFWCSFIYTFYLCVLFIFNQYNKVLECPDRIYLRYSFE